VTIRERIFSIKLLDKQKEYTEYFKELGLSCETIVIDNETPERLNSDEYIEKGGVAI
jgi:hypothetical protein